MSDQQISLAKTTRPSMSGVLPRERLFKLLDETRKCQAVWLTGPPGCGKTTLAADYVERRKLTTLWYQIDDSDNDVASFFYHVDIAVCAHAGRRNIRLPRLSPQHHVSLMPFARRYFQALYGQLGTSFSVVFDGYHELLPQSPLHEVMLAAAAHVPPGGSLVLISRSDPPAAMTRLRANRQLDVIGWRDLKLTLAESSAIVTRRGHKLAPAAQSALYEKTQGWAAGLILLLEQASAHDTITTAHDLSAPQLVFDYLAGEIFQKTDVDSQTLLLKTSHLPQMTVEMAQTISGLEDAGERLAAMHRNNYFVTLKHEGSRAIYEYHPLFREFVLARAQGAFSREQRLQLQLASAALLESEGLIAEAVQLYHAAGAWDRITSIVRRHARVTLDSGRSETLAHWIELLPRSEQESNPWTLYWLAAARMYVSPRESRRLQERAHDLFSAQPQVDARGLLLTCSGAMDAILYEVDDFSLLDRWIDVMSRLLHEQPNLVSGALEARIACSLFTSMVVRQPHHPEIEYWADRAYRASVSQPDVNVRISVEPRVALGIAYGGHFPKAAAVMDGVHAILAAEEVRPADFAMFRLVEATYCMLTGQKQACYDAVRKGLEFERAEGVTIMSHQLLAYGAGGALAVGDLDTAENMLAQFDALPPTQARFDLCLYHLFSTWLAFRRNDMVRAFQQQKIALQTAIEVGCPVFEALCRIACAQVQYQGGDWRGALRSFQHVYDIARPIRNHLLEFTGLMCYAYVALDSTRRPRSGMRALRQALAVGKPRNYRSHLLWTPESLSRLCSIALESGIEPEFVGHLIRERELAMDASSTALIDWPWPIRVTALGPFRVIKHGKPIAFSGKAQKRPFDLLKVIIANGGRDVPEERITGTLWPRIDGDSAHRSFTTTLHRLRKLLGEERAVVLSEGKVSLEGRYLWLDVWAFEQCVARTAQALRHARDGSDTAAIITLSEHLLRNYAGGFLGNDAEEAWALPLQERLRHRFRRTVSEIQRFWQQAAQPSHAIELLERALEIDNTAEGLYRDLMAIYASTGRQGDALETYLRCEKILRLQLGAAPAPETLALREQLAKQFEPSPRIQ